MGKRYIKKWIINIVRVLLRVHPNQDIIMTIEIKCNYDNIHNNSRNTQLHST